MVTKKDRERIEELYLKQKTKYDKVIQHLIRLISTQESILETYRKELDYYKDLATREAINKTTKK